MTHKQPRNVRRHLALSLAAVAFSSIGSVALATDEQSNAGLLPIPDYTGDFADRRYLTGDWNGLRTDWANHGVQIDIDWTQYLQGVVHGGLDTTTQYGGHFDYLLRLDLMKMGLLPGALVTMRAESRYGNTVNRQSGMILPVNTAGYFPLTSDLDEDQLLAITSLNYTQFLSEQFAITVGKFDTLDSDLNEFASGRGKSQFSNANFLFSSVTALRLPYSTLGAAFLWMPSPNATIKASILNTTDSSTTSGFDDIGDGATLALEGNVQYRLGNLPGGMNLGGLYSFDQDFAQIGGKLILQPGQGLTLETDDDTWAIYWSGWQYLHIAEPIADRPINTGDGRPDYQGFGLFARAGIADQDTNPVEWSISGGIGGRGMIPTRANDTYGVGYFYSHFQRMRFMDIANLEDYTQGMEAFYNVAITPAINLTFDLQLVGTALSDTDTTAIVGGRVNISF